MTHSPRAPVTAYNWQTPPHNRWAFWNVREILPVQRIHRAPAASVLESADTLPGLSTITLSDVDGQLTTVAAVLGATETDAFAVSREGAVLSEWYRPGGSADRPHAVMSITKSMVGWVAGALRERGELDADRLITAYVPELSASGYAGARVRDVADMRSGIQFNEEYVNPDSEIRKLGDWLGWYPDSPAENAPGLYRFVANLTADSHHGGPFVYRSCESDVLGWVCERAAGRPMADLLSEHLWSVIGAEHDADLLCDRLGTALHNGGASVTARDLLRLGSALLPSPQAPSWLRAAWAVDADHRAAFAASTAEAAMPGGWYRDQFWFRPGPQGDVLLGLGIYGQLLYVNRRSRTVCAKFSSWPVPQDPVRLQNTLRACDAVSAVLECSAATGTSAVRPVRSPRSLF